MNKSVVGYARVSTILDSQKTSIKNQIERIENYCKSRNWNLIAIFKDIGESGSTTDRKAFQEMKEFLSNNSVDFLIVTNLDRFSRDPKDVIREIDWLKEQNIHFVSIDQSLDTSTTAGEMVMVIMSYLNRMEREKTLEKLNKTIKHKQEQGEPLGRPPFGLEYSKETRQFIPNKDFPKVLEAIRLRKMGHSLLDIQERLNIPKSTVS